MKPPEVVSYQCAVAEVSLNIPGTPTVHLYAARVLAAVLHVTKRTIVAWDLTKQIPRPIFVGPIPSGRPHMRFRWYTADEIVAHVNCKGRFIGQHRGLYHRAVTSEISVLKRNYVEGTLRPTPRLDFEMLGRLKAAYGYKHYTVSTVEKEIERKLKQLAKRERIYDDLSQGQKQHHEREVAKYSSLGWKWLIAKKQGEDGTGGNYDR